MNTRRIPKKDSGLGFKQKENSSVINEKAIKCYRMPYNHPIHLRLGILSCLNKIEALLKFHQNCVTTSLIIHEI